MSGVDFSFLAGVILFLFATWMTGRLFRALKLPGILGELFMGILLGPNVFDLVPFASDGTCPFISFDDTATAVVANASGSLSASGSTGRRLGGSGGSGAGCKWIHTWDGKHTLDVWSFAGAFGVTLMIMESGMHINFEKVRVPPPCLPLSAARALPSSVASRAFCPRSPCHRSPSSAGVPLSSLSSVPSYPL